MKVEPDLSLVQDKFSVRYECQQSLEMDVNKSLLRFHYSEWFLYFYTFPSMLRRLSSESFNKLSTPVVIFLLHINGLCSLNTD